MEEEVWKDVAELHNDYSISSHGRLISKGRWMSFVTRGGRKSRRYHKERVLKTFFDKDGYVCIRVIDRKRGSKSFKIHRLVGQYFLDTFEPEKTINHKDFDITNNYYKNLEWATQLEQFKHRAQNGRVLFGEMIGNSKMTEKKVLNAIRLHTNGTSVASIAKKMKMSITSMYDIINGETWKHLHGR